MSMVSLLVKLLFIKSYADMGVHQPLYVIMLLIMYTANFQGFVTQWGYEQHPKVKALKLLLRCLVKSEHKHWDKFLPYALFAFNTSYNNQTGFTPFFINHGIEANLPGQTTMSLIAQHMDSEIKMFLTHTVAKILKTFKNVSI